MTRIGKKDHAVIKAFLDGRKAAGHKLDSTGSRLDGTWMGGRGIAEWVDGEVVYNDLGSRAAQTVQRAVKKAFGSGRRYHVVAITEKTGKKTRMTARPEPHHEATVILRKQTPYKHLRYQLEEV